MKGGEEISGGNDLMELEHGEIIVAINEPIYCSCSYWVFIK